MGMSNGRDTLSRVAFQLSDGTLYKFNINPSSIQENYAARNTFLQAESTMFMQGYGQGQHTITISGTTGVNSGKGFDRMKQLKSIIVNQINNAHDSANGTFLNDSTYTTLKFHNFTDNESWLVEIAPQGFSIDQDVNNPLSFTYTINMVVVGTTDTPATSELTWIQLGTKHPSFTPTALDPTKGYVYGQKIKDLDASGYITSARQFEASRDDTINNYGQSGMYKPKVELSKSQVASLYKVLYGNTVSDLDIDKYISASGYFDGSGVKNYGAGNSGDSDVLSKALPVEDLQIVYQTLFGNTVKGLDYDSYDKMDTVYQALKHGTIFDYDGDDEEDTSDSSLSVPDAVSMYSIIYGKTVKENDFTQVTNSGVSFAGSKQETINNYGQSDVGDDSSNPSTSSNSYVYPDAVNPWESYSKSLQDIYDDDSNAYYSNPYVSKDALKYSYDSLNNLLKV